MSSIKDFMIQHDNEGAKEKVLISKRLPEFEIRAITESRNEELRKANTRKTLNKRMGKVEKTTDQTSYLTDLVLECVVNPDLKNTELQTHYGTAGDQAGTLKAMLYPGEYSNLMEAIQDLNGFDIDIEELRDDAKK